MMNQNKSPMKVHIKMKLTYNRQTMQKGGSGTHQSHYFSFIIISTTDSAYMQAWANKTWCIYLGPSQGLKSYITFWPINRNLLLSVLLFKGCPNYHNLVAETTEVFSHSSGDQKFKTEVSAGWLLLWSFSLACRWLCFLLCLHTVFPLCLSVS